MHPKLVTIGPVTLHTYGLLAAIGLLVGIYAAVRLASRHGLNRPQIWNLGVYIALAALLGGKLVLFLYDWRYYSQNPREMLSLRALQAGGVYYGGIFFGALLAYLYARRHQLGFGLLADIFAPGLALGTAIGRLGCFSAGCCYGRETHLAWAVTFTDPYAARIVGVPLNTPLHPTQLYEAALLLAIFAGLLWFWHRRRYDGEVFVAFLLLYALARFGLEFFRGDSLDRPIWLGWMTTPQLLSLILFVVGAAYAVYRRRHAAGPADARPRP